jgi:hypothetical protein
MIIATVLEPHEGTVMFDKLTKIRDDLQGPLSSVMHWPLCNDPKIMSLEQSFLKGDIVEEDLRSRLRDVGVWAIYRETDDTSTVIQKE